MDRGRLIHREDAEGLVAFCALHALDDEPRTFVRGLVAVAPKHGNVQKYVWPTIVRHDEAVPLRCVEPFDDARDFDEIGRLADAGYRIDGRVARSASRIFASPQPGWCGSA